MKDAVHIGDANEHTAFITGADGFDKAWVVRATKDNVSNADHRAAIPTDAEWQKIIDLIAIAPDLLAVIKQIVEDVNEYNESELGLHEMGQLCDRMQANSVDAETVLEKLKAPTN